MAIIIACVAYVVCNLGTGYCIKHLLKSGHVEALKCSDDHNELPVRSAFSHNPNKAMIDLFIDYKRYCDFNAVNDGSDTRLHIALNLI